MTVFHRGRLASQLTSTVLVPGIASMSSQYISAAPSCVTVPHSVSSPDEDRTQWSGRPDGPSAECTHGSHSAKGTSTTATSAIRSALPSDTPRGAVPPCREADSRCLRRYANGIARPQPQVARWPPGSNPSHRAFRLNCRAHARGRAQTTLQYPSIPKTPLTSAQATPLYLAAHCSSDVLKAGPLGAHGTTCITHPSIRTPVKPTSTQPISSAHPSHSSHCSSHARECRRRAGSMCRCDCFFVRLPGRYVGGIG